MCTLIYIRDCLNRHGLQVIEIKEATKNKQQQLNDNVANKLGYFEAEINNIKKTADPETIANLKATVETIQKNIREDVGELKVVIKELKNTVNSVVDIQHKYAYQQNEMRATQESKFNELKKSIDALIEKQQRLPSFFSNNWYKIIMVITLVLGSSIFTTFIENLLMSKR